MFKFVILPLLILAVMVGIIGFIFYAASDKEW